MPVRKVSDNPNCYQWGNQKIYCGKGAKEKAIKQGIAIENTGWREAEGEIKKIPIEDIEIGSIIIFPNGDKYVLNGKEIDGEIVKILFNPFHHLKGISDIQGEVKLGTKFVVSSPRNELLKKRFGFGAEFSKFNSAISNAESDDYDRTYGKKQGAIRRRLKKKIMGQAIVGTKKGQWSARKSQELKRQYEEACEKKSLNAYKGKKTKKQKDLSKWTKQDWTTKSGKPSSETGERYLPKKAIKALTDKEYKKTSDKKRKDSKKGKQFSDQPKKIANKVAKYRAESSKPHSVTISRSSNSEKKLMAVFEDNEGKKIKTTHFGQRGASDYTKHGEKERMERYLERHGGGTTTSTKEDWKDPTTAGALSRWILWNKPSLSASFTNYKRRFGLNGDLKVSKSAEERKCKSCEKLATTVVQEGSFCYDCLPINLGAEYRADSCRECGIKEGAYSDAKLIACSVCPELSCQHCFMDEKGCKFCFGKKAETFEAAEWAGYCPQCKKWRTKEMSKKATPEIMKYKSKSLDEKHRGRLLCGKRDRGGLIQVWPMSPDYYGNFDVHMICGMPLTKVKKKAETFEAEENWMMLPSGEPYYKNRMQARFQITHDEAKVLKTLKKLLSNHWVVEPDYSDVWEDELRKKSRMSRDNLEMALNALQTRKLVKVTSIPTGKYNNKNKEIYRDLIYSLPNMYVYFNEWTDDIAQFFDEGPSGYGIIENPRKARLKKRFGLGAENKTTNKVLLVGGIIAGLIGLNKLLGK